MSQENNSNTDDSDPVEPTETAGVEPKDGTNPTPEHQETLSTEGDVDADTDPSPKEGKKEQEDPLKDDDTVHGYNEYSDPVLNQVTNVLKDAKVSVEDANEIFKNAIEQNDISLLNTEALVEKIGKDKADIVQALAENYYNKQKQIADTLRSRAVEVTGDEATLDTVLAWSKEKSASDPEFAKVLNEARELINSGSSMAVKAAMQELYGRYQKDPDTTVSANTVEPTGAAPSSPTLTPLSRMEYARECNAVHTKHGSNQAMLNSLWQRRQLGQQQGI